MGRASEMAKNKRRNSNAKSRPDRASRAVVDVRTLVVLAIAACAGFWSAGSTKVGTGLTVAVGVLVVLLDITRP